MRILVLGAKGTVGTPLVETLKQRGHEVFGAGLRHAEEPTYDKCDIREFRQLERLMWKVQPDVVYNLAAEFGRWNGEDYYENLWNTNVVGLKHILTLQKGFRFKLVHFSSSEVYGDWDGIMVEDVMEKYEVCQLNDYAMTKWVNEQQIMNAAKMSNTETVRVRLFNTYGPGECYSPYRSAMAQFCYKALHDQPYTVYAFHKRTWTYIADCCETLSNIVNNFKPGEVYNIAGDHLVSMKKVSDIILRMLGKSDDKVTYKDAEPYTTKDKAVSITKAAADLEHRTTVDLEEGIQLTLDWMKRTYNVIPQRPSPIKDLMGDLYPVMD